MDTFTFEAAEEVFSNSVVIGITLAGHALAESKVNQALPISTSSILDAAIGVKDEAAGWAASANGHSKSGKGEIGIDTVGEGIADDLSGTEVFDSGEIKPALVGRDVGDIADPSLVGSVEGKLAHEEIGRDGMGMPGVRSHPVSAFAHREDVQLFHEAVNALARTGKLVADQVVQAVKAEGRILHMQRQQPAFERLIVQLARRRFAVQPFIVPAAGDFKQSA